MKRLIYLILLTSIITSCKQKAGEENIPVAKVFDKYLFTKEIKEIIPENSSKEDSIIMTNSYVKQWITKQLLLRKAEQNLTAKEKDITKLINDYKSSILIHRYKEKLIEQKLDFSLSEDQLKEYYNKYKFNFILRENIIKATYIKIPISAPGLQRIRSIYKSNRSNDLEELENYCMTNAKKFDNFDDFWISASKLLSSLPIEYDNEEIYLKNHNFIEVKDAEYVYFVKINDIGYINTQAPFEYVTDDINQIVRNKKRLEFEAELDKEIYKEAQENQLYTTY